MFNGRTSHRGQVLIIFVFAIVGLVAIVGLAVDGGSVYADRRQAQNAADTAALAAAVTRDTWEKTNQASCNNFNTETNTLPACSTTPITGWPSIIDAALNAASNNGYTNDLVQSTVNVYNPPRDGTYSDCTQTSFDCHDYVEVVIQSNVNTFFARVLGIGQLHNTVEAVALSHYSAKTALYGGMSLVELGQGKGSCPSDFNVGGSGTVTLTGGGIYVNSSNTDCAYKQTSCTTTLVLQGGASVNVVGGWDLNGCNSPTINKATTIYPFPPDHLISEPSQCATAGTFNSTVQGTTTYNPGNYYGYNSFPINSDTAILNPGVYCISGQLQTNKDMTGTGVMFYIRPTGAVKISGGSINISAQTSGTYQGYLIYQDWDNTSTVQNCGIQGNNTSQYTGLIFVPYCDITISGTSGSNGFGSQIIAYTISLTGTNDLYFTYNANQNAQIPEKDWAGLFH